MNPVSPKRQREGKLYSLIREKFLEGRTCELCGIRPATDFHHSSGRIGDDYLDVSKAVATCRKCHRKEHGQ